MKLHSIHVTLILVSWHHSFSPNTLNWLSLSLVHDYALYKLLALTNLQFVYSSARSMMTSDTCLDGSDQLAQKCSNSILYRRQTHNWIHGSLKMSTHPLNSCSSFSSAWELTTTTFSAAIAMSCMRACMCCRCGVPIEGVAHDWGRWRQLLQGFDSILEYEQSLASTANLIMVFSV